MEDMILEEILKVVRGELTPIAAANTIDDWCEEEAQNVAEGYIDEAQRRVDQVESDRIEDMEYASRTTGTPDMFSDEMRGFWIGYYML